MLSAATVKKDKKKRYNKTIMSTALSMVLVVISFLGTNKQK